MGLTLVELLDKTTSQIRRSKVRIFSREYRRSIFSGLIMISQFECRWFDLSSKDIFLGMRPIMFFFNSSQIEIF